MRPTFFQCTTVLSVISAAVAAPSSRTVSFLAYANDFVDPDYILAKKFGNNTEQAQATVTAWASELAASGPWSVVNKSVSPPSGDKHDYLSWAPYWWPDCSGVGNTTELTPEQVWVTCPYKSRDGQFNPDGRLVNNVGAFQDFAEAVFYNTLAWTFATDASAKSVFEADVVRFLRAWFLDADTKMNPNLAYGQMQRGPDGQVGTHTGVLDLKAMAKVASAVLLLRKGGSTQWTTALDNELISWAKEYITWLETADIAVEEAQATNNHGTFYYNQLAALKLIVNDNAGARAVTNKYFDGLYMNQIVPGGEQPLEARRTRPYHYRAYNLAAMITNARIATYVDPKSDVWNKPTVGGTTIKNALDFAMTIDASESKETSYAKELYPNIAAVASVYGDADSKYLTFLKRADPAFMKQAYILWNQPFALNEESGRVITSTPTSATAKSSATAKGTTEKGDSSTTKGEASTSNSVYTAPGSSMAFVATVFIAGFTIFM